MPVIAMEAKTETVAPPRTHWGIVVRSAENLGINPAARSMNAVSAITFLFTTFVDDTIPTFCEYVAFGRPPNNDDNIFDAPNPIIPPLSSLAVGSLSMPPIVVADISPIACTALIAKRMENARVDENSNRIPNGAIFGSAKTEASLIAFRSTIPKNAEKI